jgi:hypothetical protein
MADDTSASIITLHQPKRPKTPAERARAYRERKKGKSLQDPTEHAASTNIIALIQGRFCMDSIRRPSSWSLALSSAVSSSG